MYYVGIDLGGTGIKAGLVDEQGHILEKVSCPTKIERGHEAVIADMARLSYEVIEKAGKTLDDVKAIGIGLPGVLDPRNDDQWKEYLDGLEALHYSEWVAISQAAYDRLQK